MNSCTVNLWLLEYHVQEIVYSSLNYFYLFVCFLLFFYCGNEIVIIQCEHSPAQFKKMFTVKMGKDRLIVVFAQYFVVVFCLFPAA